MTLRVDAHDFGREDGLTEIIHQTLARLAGQLIDQTPARSASQLIE